MHTRSRGARCLTFVLVAIALWAAPLLAAPAYVPGELIVKFKPGVSTAQKSLLVPGQKVKDFRFIGAEHWKIGSNSVEATVAALEASGNVEYAEPNYLLYLLETPTDPLFTDLWGMNNTGQTGGTPDADIDAVEAWSVFHGSPSVVVAVIDTGIDYTHPDLAANAWTNPGEIAGNGIDDDANGFIDDIHGWDFVNNDNDPMDDHDHGSHCSGTIGAVANNGIGVAGVNWDVKIMGVKFLNSSGSGSTAGAISCIEYATMMGVDVMSNSWGGGGYDVALEAAIQAAYVADIFFIAAAGNSGSNNDVTPNYPSNYPGNNVIAVLATNHNDVRVEEPGWWSSSYGATTVDIGAPGLHIWSSTPGNTYQDFSGTSMATPHVAGAMAMLRGRFPGITVDAGKNLLLTVGNDPLASLSGLCVSGARLNLLKLIGDPDTTNPGAVIDLAVTGMASNWIALQWTAPGDDGNVGTAMQYDVRYAAAPIVDEAGWTAASQATGEPNPAIAGTVQTLQVNGLVPSNTYYFSLRARDEYANLGDLSNSPDGTTMGPPTIAVSPTSMSASLPTGGTETQMLTISNVGVGVLDFTIPSPSFIIPAKASFAPVKQHDYMELDKGAGDTRVGIPSLNGSGGPDAFGYKWTDSDAAGGPAFNWIDISGVGTAVTLYDDSNEGPFNLGFTFPFYGVDHTTFRIGSNGFVSFTSSSSSLSNSALPSAGAPENLLALLWDDLYPTGSVHYYNDGTRMIVQYTNWGNYSAGGPYTMQMHLYPNGTVEYHYLTMTAPTSESATIGIQNGDGTDGLTVAFNAAYVHNNLAIRFTALPPWLSVAPGSGSLAAGASMDVGVTFDATGLCGSHFDADIHVLSNDPLNPDVVVPAGINLSGTPDISINPTSLAFGSVYITGSATLNIDVTNGGCVDLNVSGLGFDHGDFTSAQALPAVILAGATLSVPVTFTPTTADVITGMLTIACDDPDDPLVAVPLSGTGVLPPVIAVTPASLSSTLYPGGLETRTMAIGNTGQSDLSWSAAVGADAARKLYRLPSLPPPPLPSPEAGTLPPSPSAAPNLAELTATLRDLTGVRILWDQSHGQEPPSYYYSTMVAELELRGADVFENKAPLTSSLLATCDLVWARETYAPFTPAEISALTAWLNNGGGLLLEGDESPSSFNALLAAAGAGITYGNYASAGTTTNVYPHPTTVDVDVLYLANPLTGLSAVTSPAGLLAADNYGQAALAWSQVQSGRVVALCDELLDDYAVSSEDNRLFGNQVIDWLADASWLKVEPAAGVVAAGATQDVTVTFDATSLCGGAFAAQIAVTSNDPLAPEVTVPAALDVIGESDITVTPPSLAFGLRFLGAVVTDTLIVVNDGCELLTVSAVMSDQFEFTATPAGPFTVAPAAAQTLLVTYMPTTVGAVSGLLSIASDDPDEALIAVALSGTGAEPPVIAVTPASLSSTLYPGGVEAQTLTIGNAGRSDLMWSAAIQQVGKMRAYTLPSLPEREPVSPGKGPSASTHTPVSGPALVATLRDLTGLRILWVRAHGEYESAYWSDFVSDLEARGAVLTESYEPVTAALLDGFDVAYVNFGYKWPTAEITALTGWLQAGGGLLLERNEYYVANSILGATGAGITYTSGYNGDGATTSIHAHEMTADVSRLYLGYSYTYLSSVVAPAGVLAQRMSGEMSLAWSEVGLGRIVALTGLLFLDGYLPLDDNRLFGNQVIDWLAGTNWMRVEPATGVVAAGTTQDVTVTFDATDLCGGAVAAQIAVTSNDPLTPVVAVPASLDVMGESDITVTPQDLAFEPRFIGAAVTDTLTVTNDGCELLTVSTVTSDQPEFTVTPAGPFTVAPDATRTLLVTYTPTTVGAVSGQLSITSDDPDEPLIAVPLSGTGVAPPVIAVTPASLSSTLHPGGTETRTLTIGNTGQSDLIWSTAIEALGATNAYTLPSRPEQPPFRPGKSPSPSTHTPVSGPALVAALRDLTGVRILWVYAHGEAGPVSWSDFVGDLEARGAVLAVSSEPVTATLLDDFDIAYVNFGNAPWPTAEITALTTWLLAGGSLLLDSSGIPVANPILGAVGAGITYAIGYNSGGVTTSVHAHAMTSGVADLYMGPSDTYIYSVAAPAGMLAQRSSGQASLAWSKVGMGRIVALADPVLNNSLLPLEDNRLFGNQLVDWLAGSDWLGIEPSAGVVAAGATQDVTVTFIAPDDCLRVLSSQITVTSNDPVNPVVAVAASLDVSGAPEITIAPMSLDFGQQYLGAVATRTLTVTNEGCDLLSVSAVTSDQIEFTITPAGLFTLEPNATRALVVTYTPTTAGSVSGLLSIASDDPDEPVLTVALTGTGVEPPVIAVTPDSLSVMLQRGDVTQRTLTVNNTGQSPLSWTASHSSAALHVYNLPPRSWDTQDAVATDLPQPSVDVMPSPGLTTALRDLTGVHIMWDASHGQGLPSNWAGMVGDLELRGAEVVINSLPVSAAILADIEIFWTIRSYWTWGSTEVSALANWLNAGGGLVLEGDSDVSVGAFNTILSAAGAGIVFDGANAQAGTTTAIFSHQTTAGVTGLYLNSPMARLATVVAPAQVLIRDAASVPVVACGTAGAGRVMALSDEVFGIWGFSRDHNRLFGNQVFDWLVGTRWLSVQPTSGTVASGSFQELTVTFSAVAQPDGQYNSSIIVQSNDPLTPFVDVPARLTVVGGAGSPEVSIGAAIGASTSEVITAGVADGATDGYDAAFDFLAAGPVPNFIAASFPHPEWLLPSGDRFRTDLRAPYDLAASYKSWRFQVMTDQVGQIVLTFVPNAAIPAATSLQLVDRSTGQIHDLRANPTYAYLTTAPGMREFSLNLGDGLPAADPSSRSIVSSWSMVGTPLLPPTGATMQDVILAQAPPGSWLYAWEPQTAHYAIVPGGTPCVPGEGMWLYTPGTFEWTMSGTMNTAEVPVPLAHGWNMVGYPLWFAGDMAGVMVEHGGSRYTFAAAVAQGLVAGMAFDFDASGAYQPTTDLVPWRSYWVASYASDVVLRFHYLRMEATAQLPLPAFLAARQEPTEWAATARIENSGARVTLGQSTGATDGFDAAWDLPAPPPSPSAAVSATIALPRADWLPAISGLFMSDVRAVGEQALVFPARVTTAAPGVVRLSWDCDDFPENRDLEIRSGGRTLVRSMRSECSVDLAVGGAPLDLEFATTGGSSAAALLAEGLHLRNQPNPFNPSTQLQFNLARDGETEIMIYDTRGVLVRQIRAGHLPAGSASLTWDGMDRRGQLVASGVYLYRLLQEGQQLGTTQKMVLLK